MAKNHFFQKGFQSYRTRLDPEPWGEVRDQVARGTADVVVTRGEEVLLGRRAHEPQTGEWIIGGGMSPGESFEEAAARNISRELGITVEDLERFQYLDVYNYVWDTRAEPPEGHGCHDVSVTMVLEISDKEAKEMRFNEEYSSVSWWRPEAIISDDKLHPALRQMARDFIEFRKSNGRKIFDLLADSVRRRLPKWVRRRSTAA
ncbi:MAG: NUDIX hydrolase [Parcubacteria group bacterium]